MNRKPWAEICLVILGSILYFMANLQRVAVPGTMFDTLTHDLTIPVLCLFQTSFYPIRIPFSNRIKSCAKGQVFCQLHQVIDSRKHTNKV